MKVYAKYFSVSVQLMFFFFYRSHAVDEVDTDFNIAQNYR